MKISIITAVYNREATIAQAIASVRRQTYQQVEHLVVDGASTDGTLSVIDEVKHARMSLISEPDQGIYDALNKGVDRTTGEIVGVVHSDDFLAHERVLEKVAQAFEATGADAVYGNLDYVSATDEDRIIRHWVSGSYHPRRLGQGWMPPHPALFVRRSVLERFGAYDTRYGIAADYDAILRWFNAGIRVDYIPEVLAKMRVGGASNGSLARALNRTKEEYQVLRANGVGGLGALAQRKVRKLPQLFLRERKAGA